MFSALSQVPALWPFPDAWASPGSRQANTLSARRPTVDAGKSFVQEAIQVMWSLQETQSLNQATAMALFQSVMASLNGHADRAHVAPWLTILQAHQHALQGDLPSARAMLTAMTRQDDADAPVAMACEVIGWYRLALLTACPMDSEGLQAAVDVPDCQRTLAPALPVLRRLKACQTSLPASIRSHLARIAAVAQADDPLAFSQKDRSQLLQDTLRAPTALQRAHAMLALGLACLATGQDARARACFEQTWHAASSLQWRPAAWLSGVALLSMPAPDVGAATTPADLRASLQTLLQAWRDDAPPTAPDAAEADPPPASEPSRIDSAIAFIRQHADKRFSVEDLARHCGVSTRTLSQGFKDALGLSPLDFITRERMQQARRLLSEGDRSLLEVAGMVGYDTALGLSKAYVKVFGEPPRSKFSRVKS